MDDLFPPFEPDANEPRPRRFKPVPFRMIAPNMITLMALCLGLTAIRLAFEGKFDVVPHGVALEHRGALELAADAEPGDLRLVARQQVDVGPEHRLA